LRVTEGVVEVTLLMVKLNTGWRCVVSAMPWPLYSIERDSVPIVQEAGWAPGLVWVGVEKRKSLATTRVSTPDHPVCSKSLY
jgi:hypothetical protein